MVWLVRDDAHARMPEVLRPVCDAFEAVFHVVKMRRLQLLFASNEVKSIHNASCIAATNQSQA